MKHGYVVMQLTAIVSTLLCLLVGNIIAFAITPRDTATHGSSEVDEAGLHSRIYTRVEVSKDRIDDNASSRLKSAIQSASEKTEQRVQRGRTELVQVFGEDYEAWPITLRDRLQLFDGIGEERACGETLVESYDRNQTIRWTERAERLLYERLMQTQFPESCAAAKWLLVSMPAYQGLMSDLHYFQVQLVFGMFLGRTVIPLPEIDLNLGDKRHNHAVRPDLYHMGNYFHFLSGCPVLENGLVNGTLAIPPRPPILKELFSIPIASPSSFSDMLEVVKNDERRVVWLRERDTQHKLLRKRVGNSVPADIWAQLVQSGQVFIEGLERPCKETDIHRHLQTFFLRSVLARFIFAPKACVVNRAAEILDGSTKKPMAVVHVRRTDKSSEDPNFKRTGEFAQLSTYVTALVEARVNWATIYLMSDDMVAITELTNLLKTHFPASAIRYQEPSLNLGRTKTLPSGMTISGHHSLPEAEKKFDFLTFIAEVWGVTRAADYFVGTFSSNVGRAIEELLGAQKCAGQVDVSGPLATSIDDKWIPFP